MSDFNSGGAMGGAASGAAMGTQIMPGYGTAIGAVAGGLMGGFMGGSKASGPDIAGMLQQRLSQIDQFQQQLDLNRSGLMDRMANLQQSAMARYLPNLEANLAGRGLSPGGGAFNSAFARAAANNQSQYDMTNMDWSRQDLNKIADMRQNVFSQGLGFAMNQANQANQANMQSQGAMGGLMGAGINSLFSNNQSSSGGIMALMKQMQQGQGGGDRSVFNGGISAQGNGPLQPQYWQQNY